MELILAAVLVLIFSGVIAKICGEKESRSCDFWRLAGPIGAALLCMAPIITVLLGGNVPSLSFPWSVPLGSFIIELDAVSAFFLLPIMLLESLSAIYGISYLKKYREKKRSGSVWLSFNLLIASMIMVVVARNAILFLMAWEVMSLSSFFLVMFENQKDSTHQVGWLYFSMTHIGAVALIVFFLLMGHESGNYDFSSLKVDQGLMSSICFMLSLIGFGTKAGIIPLHIWLPEAHPAAPSHVSAIMSGVMIKTGIYGIVRTLMILPSPYPVWWGLLLIILGGASGLFGVVYAMAQQDVKRLLAYCSVENIGIILMGIGLGVYGLSIGSPWLALFGFAGGLLHVLNHALFKGLLFLSVGHVIQSVHNQRIDQMGGLIKTMPLTALSFLIGSVAICGVPPLNGFISEVLLYFGAFREIAWGGSSQIFPPLFVILSLALIGGLAVICFSKAFSIIFLGEPRSLYPKEIDERDKGKLIPMLILSFLCVIIGVYPVGIVPLLQQPLLSLTHFNDSLINRIFASEFKLLNYIGLLFGIFFLFVSFFIIVRMRLGLKRKTDSTVTWDCGYMQPTARIQYTGSSYVSSMIEFCNSFLRTKKDYRIEDSLFPRYGSLKMMIPDTLSEKVFRPFYNRGKEQMAKLVHIQHGGLHLYVLYIMIALVGLLLWKLG